MLSMYPQVVSGARRLISRHGSHLAVGVGSVRSEVLVGDLGSDVFASSLPPYLLWSFVVVAFEKSSHYVEAAVVTVVAVLVMALRDGSSRWPTVPPCGTVGGRR